MVKQSVVSLGALVLALAGGSASAQTDVNVVNVPTVHVNNASLKVSGPIGVRMVKPSSPISTSFTLNAGAVGNSYVYGAGTIGMSLTSLLVTNESNAVQTITVNAIQTDSFNCAGAATTGGYPNFHFRVPAGETRQFTFPTGLNFSSSVPCVRFITTVGAQVHIQIDGAFQ